jgi:hypothetical protein
MCCCLPIYASQDILQRRFDESLAAAFKKQRTGVAWLEFTNRCQQCNTAESMPSSSIIVSRQDLRFYDAIQFNPERQQAQVAHVAQVVQQQEQQRQQQQQPSLVRQGLVKFESQTKLALPTSARPISLQQRLQLDQTLRNPTPPAAPQPQLPLPPQQQLPTPSPAVTRTSPRSPSIAVGLSHAPQPTTAPSAAPAAPPLCRRCHLSPKAPPAPTDVRRLRPSAASIAIVKVACQAESMMK